MVWKVKPVCRVCVNWYHKGGTDKHPDWRKSNKARKGW